jgi:LPS-assembly protein
MNIFFNRILIFVALVSQCWFSYATNEKNNTTKEYSSSDFNLKCLPCSNIVNNITRKSTDWYPKILLDQSTTKKLPYFICGAYIEPKNYISNPSDDTIDLTASHFSINEQQVANLWRNVTIKFRNYYIECEQAKIEKAINYYSLIGDVKIRQKGVLLIGDKASLSGNTQQAEITNSDFILYNSNSHGHADSIKVNSQGVLEFKNAYYTSCPPNKELWSISGKKITYNNLKNTLEVNNAKFKIYNTPIFWLPYLAFSTDFTDTNQGKTGFLTPSLDFTSFNKSTISIPFYWNIAPNYDNTITLKYLQNKGILVNNEFRYLTKILSGEHQGNLYTSLFTLPGTKAKANNQNGNYYISYQHQSNFENNLSVLVDYNKAKNHKYFTELKLEKIQKKYLTQQVIASYNTKDNNANYKITPKIELYDVQRLDHDFAVPYKKLPNLSLEGYWQQNDNFKLKANLDYTRFISNNSQVINLAKLERYGVSIINGERFYADLTAKYNKNIGKFYVKPEIKLTQLQYNLDDIDPKIINPYLSSVYDNFKADSFTSKPSYIGAGFNIKCGTKLVKTILSNNDSWNLTFKPKVKYSLSPYINNQCINPVFDSHMTKINSYSSLWNSNRFTGKDRISDHNQLALGVSTKFTNSDKSITYGFKFGQILYFADRKVWINPKTNSIYYDHLLDLDLQQEQEKIQQQLVENYSPLILDSYIDINNKFKLQAVGALDVGNNQLRSFMLATDYYFFDRYSLKLAYNYEQRSDRFVKDINKQFIIENNTRKRVTNNLNELRFSLYYPITEQINMISGLKYDIMNSRTTDVLAGIEYSNCCFQVRLVANKWLDRSSNFDFPKERYRVLLTFKLYGLSITDNSYNSISSKLEDYTKAEI